MLPFIQQDELPVDTLERAKVLLAFVRSWSDADKHWILNDNEMYGISLMMDAITALITDALSKMRGEIVIDAVPGMTIVVQPENVPGEKTAPETGEDTPVSH